MTDTTFEVIETNVGECCSSKVVVPEVVVQVSCCSGSDTTCC